MSCVWTEFTCDGGGQWRGGDSRGQSLALIKDSGGGESQVGESCGQV